MIDFNIVLISCFFNEDCAYIFTRCICVVYLSSCLYHCAIITDSMKVYTDFLKLPYVFVHIGHIAWYNTYTNIFCIYFYGHHRAPTINDVNYMYSIYKLTSVYVSCTSSGNEFRYDSLKANFQSSRGVCPCGDR